MNTRDRYFIGRKVYRTRDMSQAAFDQGHNIAGTVERHHSSMTGYILVEWSDGTVEWLTGNNLPYAPSA